MRFSIAAVVAFAGVALAQIEGFNPITKPTEGEVVPAGSTYEIVWQPSAKNPGSIAISLLGGSDPKGLTVVAAIASGLDAATGKYSWKVDESLGKLATYGIMITLETNPDIFQYGFPFKIAGGSTSTSASATKTETTTKATDTSKTASVTKTTAHTSESTTIVPPTSTIVSSTIHGNVSTSAPGEQTTVITSVVTPPASKTTTATSSLVTNGVATVAAGGFAMLGGLAMAVLAL